MRTRIVSLLLVLFILFLAGSGLAMLSLYRTTSNLESVINLHKVEILRQELVINAQTVQSHLYSFGTAFGPELDVIVENVVQLNNSARHCLSCHHDEKMTRRLQEVVSLVDQYQDALSYLITTSANEERIERLRMVAIGIGTNLLGKVQEMSLIAGQKLNEKSVSSLKQVNNTRVILIATLVLSFFIAIGIAVSMTRQITEPVYELLDAVRQIQNGKLGYTTRYRGKYEFQELISAVNETSLTLERNNREIMRHMSSLSNLYSITLSLHSLSSTSDIFRELSQGAAELVGAEQCGLVMLENGEFVHKNPSIGLDRDAARMLRYKSEDMLKLHTPSTRRAFYANENIADIATGRVEHQLNVRNVMYLWVKQKGEIVGVLRAANKRGGPFIADDIHPLAILANNVAVALENARLYQDLREQMASLERAQEQLVQAAKLVAIGELASNVAHELNNPLTTVLGYAELLKEEKDIDSIISDVDVIERECLRAKDIIRQLLQFARKRELKVSEFDINNTLNEVLGLAQIQNKKNRVVVVREFGPDTIVKADENQMKQVFLNIVNNAFQAMDTTGSLTVTTSGDGNCVSATIKDTGAGITKENLARIFEPFFSTKKEKGTGIGLSVSYQIIRSHGGTIEVESEPGKGTTFTVYIPKTPVQNNGKA